MADREEMIRALFAKALDRVLRGEKSKHCARLIGALLLREEVPDLALEIILEAMEVEDENK